MQVKFQKSHQLASFVIRSKKKVKIKLLVAAHGTIRYLVLVSESPSITEKSDRYSEGTAHVTVAAALMRTGKNYNLIELRSEE